MILLNNRIYGFDQGAVFTYIAVVLSSKSSPYGTVEDPVPSGRTLLRCTRMFLRPLCTVDGGPSVEVLKVGSQA